MCLCWCSSDLVDPSFQVEVEVYCAIPNEEEHSTKPSTPSKSVFRKIRKVCRNHTYKYLTYDNNFTNCLLSLCMYVCISSSPTPSVSFLCLPAFRSIVTPLARMVQPTPRPTVGTTLPSSLPCPPTALPLPATPYSLSRMLPLPLEPFH